MQSLQYSFAVKNMVTSIVLLLTSRHLKYVQILGDLTATKKSLIDVAIIDSLFSFIHANAEINSLVIHTESHMLK